MSNSSTLRKLTVELPVPEFCSFEFDRLGEPKLDEYVLINHDMVPQQVTIPYVKGVLKLIYKPKIKLDRTQIGTWYPISELESANIQQDELIIFRNNNRVFGTPYYSCHWNAIDNYSIKHFVDRFDSFTIIKGTI